MAKYQVDGVWYFQTKGDGNGTPYPESVASSEYDSNTLWHTGQGVPQDLILGKVIMRIPYFGHITLFLRNNSWGLPLIIALIVILLLIEFIVPYARKSQAKNKVVAGSGGESTVQQFTLLSG